MKTFGQEVKNKPGLSTEKINKFPKKLARGAWGHWEVREACGKAT